MASRQCRAYSSLHGADVGAQPGAHSMNFNISENELTDGSLTYDVVGFDSSLRDHVRVTFHAVNFDAAKRILQTLTDLTTTVGIEVDTMPIR